MNAKASLGHLLLLALLFTLLGVASLSFGNAGGIQEAAAQPPEPASASTTITLYPEADTWIDKEFVDTNYGSSTLLTVGSNDCPGVEFPHMGRAMLRFNLSAIPAGQVIESATLKVWVRYISSSAPWSNLAISMHLVRYPWNEYTMTWHDTPDYTTAYWTSTLGVWTDSWAIWNATNAVRDWYTGAHDNNGLILVSTQESSCNQRQFDSREGANDPQLVITYGAPTPTPTYTPTKTATPTITPTPSKTPTGTLKPSPTFTKTRTATATRTKTTTATKTPTPGVDFLVDNLEITQAVQDLNNTVVLIADKRTFVRAHVHASSGSHANVLGQFTITRGSTTIGPYVADNPGARITVQASPNRAQINDSFWFEIPSSMLSTGSVQICFDLNPDHFVPENNYGNNHMCRTVALTTSPPAKVHIYTVRYTANSTTHEASANDVYRLVKWMRSVYPIPSLDWTWSTLNWTQSQTPGNAGCTAVNTELANQRSLDGNPARWRYYGMVVDTGGWMTGCAQNIPSFIASGPTGNPANWPATSTWDGTAWDTDDSFGDWYGAHELGHTYNRYHAMFCGAAGGVSYPYPNGIIGGPTGNTDRYFGWNADLKEVMPSTSTDMMTYCADEWISDFTYAGIRSRIASEGTGSAASEIPASSAGPYLLISGIIDLETHEVDLWPIYRLSDLAVHEPTPGPDWTIVLRNGGVAVATYPFTPSEAQYGPGPRPAPQASFSETVPWVAGTTWIAIRYRGQDVAGRGVSAHAPWVTVTYPNAGGVLETPYVLIRWQAGDNDGDALTFVVQYSADAGGTWQTLVTGLTETSYRADLTQLPGSDQALFRIIASDGVNTSVDECNHTLQVPRKPPTAVILDPSPFAKFTPEQQVTLVGMALDREDGNLPDSAYRWTSNRQGPLGEGPNLSVRGLMEGWHEINLWVTDSDMQVGHDSVLIFVGPMEPAVPRIWLPVVMK